MRTAIIGLPQVGKTSLFKILTGSVSESRVGATKVQLGVAKVPDERLAALARVFEPRKVTPATVEYADMPGLSREALREPSYIGSLRTVDAFAHVLRLFEDDTVMHVEGSPDPVRDWANIDLELVLNDLQVVENRLERLSKDIKRRPDVKLATEHELLLQCRSWLEQERPLREMSLDPEQAKLLKGFQFLSEKPMLLVLNIGEERAGQMQSLQAGYEKDLISGRKNLAISAVCGSVESELVDLDEGERKDYLESYGLAESGIERLVAATYDLLGLMSFLTAGESECRAWTIRRGSSAVSAAGAVHTDFAKRFIRAETIQWDVLVSHGGYAKAKQSGELRLEGKDYIVQDGDVLVFRHG
ncbi:MAG: redox-regulated ATPase YchF [Bryobacterales bacterium]|nr:redox-regulated ATPase YchF [Bryobacterales bacterium]